MPTITARKCPDPAEAAVKELPSPYIGSFESPDATGAMIFMKRGSALEHATTRVAQLTSLLSITRGVGGETFRQYSDLTQENVLWLASSLASEVEASLELLGEELREDWVRAGK